MTQSQVIDKMSYEELKKLKSKLLHELLDYGATNEQETTWTHYGLTTDSRTHVHNNKKLKCTLCNKKFYRMPWLVRHMESNHKVIMTKKQNPLLCRKGFKIWHKPEKFNDEYLFNCVMCGDTFSNMKDIRKHKAAGHPELCKISGCQARFGTKNDLRSHLKTKHNVVEWKMANSHKVYLTTPQA